MDFLKNIKVGYSLVVGIVKGNTKKDGKPFELYNLVTRISDKDNNCKVEQVFNFDVHNGAAFNIALGDKVMFLYSGNGSYKKIVEVLKQKD